MSTIKNPPKQYDFDYAVVGGGFYGCCLALFLSSISKRVLLVEASQSLMSRASRVNQARVHTGFHYPRSATTAVRSMALHRRFIADFSGAINDEFKMLYAVAKHHSKVTAKRFYRMFDDMGAPIEYASPSQMALFDNRTIAAAFSCFEVAFDYSILSQMMNDRLEAAGVEVRLATEAVGLHDIDKGARLSLSDRSEPLVRYAFNVSYSQINAILAHSGLPRARLKHEIAEIALIEPPSELEGLGVTVMDGPFFSCMPFPSTKFYSFTHVRYTPHDSWVDSDHRNPYTYFEHSTCHSRFPFMVRDAQRYMPCLSRSTYKESIFDIKTVLVKNEGDDGRPVLYQRKPSDSRIISVMGGKIDNVYDLFDLVRATSSEFSGANDRNVIGRKA